MRCLWFHNSSQRIQNLKEEVLFGSLDISQKLRPCEAERRPNFVTGSQIVLNELTSKYTYKLLCAR